MRQLPPFLRRALRRLVRTLRWERADRDLRDEVAHHLDEAAARHVDAGLDPAEACRRAALEFGGADRWLERTREARGLAWLRNGGTDLRSAIRQLAGSPVLASVAVLSLAVALGVVVSVVALVNGLLFKPLPVPDAHELHQVYTRTVFDRYGAGEDWEMSRLSQHSSFTTFRAVEENGVFSAIAALTPPQATSVMGGTFGPESRQISWVSPAYFSALRLPVVHGRDLRPTGFEPELILSDRAWRRDFGASERVLGSTIRINDVPLTIVGVAPPGFDGIDAEIAVFGWAPLYLQPATLPDTAADWRARPVDLADPDDRRLRILARLPDRISLDAAQRRMDVLTAQLTVSEPEQWRFSNQTARGLMTGKRRLIVRPQTETRSWHLRVGEMQRVLAGVAVVLSLLLAVACTNVAGLLLARSMARRQEVAVRLSLGASRGRMAAQLLAEGVLLASLGLLGGWVVVRWLLALVEARFVTGPFDIAPDGRVWLVGAAAALLSTVLFALAPLRLTLCTDVRSLLSSGTRNGGTARGHGRGLVIAVQVAAATLLLVGGIAAFAGLRTHSHTDLGYVSEGLVLARLGPNVASNASLVHEYRDAARELADRMPDVSATATAWQPPTHDFRGDGGERVELPGGTVAYYKPVGVGYLKTVGLRLLQGRPPTEADVADGVGVAVVNRALARATGVRVGDRLPVERGFGTMPVVGIVEDVREYLARPAAEPFIYVVTAPPTVEPGRIILHDHYFLLLRARPGSEVVVTTALRRALLERYPTLPPPQLRTHADYLGEITDYQRLASNAALVVGGVQLALAAAGIYALLLFMALARTRELGIRMALGARPRQAGWAVAREGIRWTVRGVFWGLLLSAPMLYVARFFLVGGGAFDPTNVLAAVLTLAVATGAAAWAPVRRAARTQPAVALRHQ